MVRRPAGRRRINAIEPEVAQFQRIHEHIDRANRIALVDPIIEAFRQQRRLLAIRPLNETPHHFPPPIQRENHSIDQVFTQAGPTAVIGSVVCCSSEATPTQVLVSVATMLIPRSGG
jgi:hypothetical protein